MTGAVDLDSAGLSRAPDVEQGLRAWDAADALLLDDASPLIDEADVVVLGDSHGALTWGALRLGARRVRVHQDSLLGELAREQNLSRDGIPGDERNLGTSVRVESIPLDEDAVRGAEVALVRLPRSLDALDDLARVLARGASPDVAVLAGGRVKHMTLAMTDVLRTSFDRVEASLARQKSRVLRAAGPRPVDPPLVREREHADLGLTVRAVGGAFAGTAIDIGTRQLLVALEHAPAFDTAIDLGCGTGVLATSLALRHPLARVIATDVSAAAVRSATLTAERNGARVEVRRDAGLATQPDASADLVVLNPPFHVGAAVTTDAAVRLFADAARVLRPGGELWAVWNSHLRYRPELERIVGPTRQLSRSPKFTVTASVRASSVNRPPTTGAP